MTTRKFMLIALAVAAAVLALGAWMAREAPVPGFALVVASLALAAWALGARQRRMWAWQVARMLTWMVFALAAAAVVAAAALFAVDFGMSGTMLIVPGAFAAAALAASACGLWRVLRHLRRERGLFDATRELERTLGRSAA